jgi:hypothetical protein
VLLCLEDVIASNQLASDWMHRGMDLAGKNSVKALKKAIRCFDEAIQLRRTLPLEDNPFFRYGLSAGWINRGDALARLGGDHFLTESIKSYDEALSLLESLSLDENVLYPRRLAITWINRGTALQNRETTDSLWEAVECFREAIAVLQHPTASAISDLSPLLAGAWTNLAGALINSGEEDEGARSAARHALELIQLSEKKEIASAEVGLKARHGLCRLAARVLLSKKNLPQNCLAEAAEAADGAMILARHWQARGTLSFVKLAREIFRFGCRIYATGQPHFLAEFLLESLVAETHEAPFLLDQETFEAAQAAIWSALEKLQFDDGFQFVAAPHFQSFLSDVVELRKVEERLQQLRTPRATMRSDLSVSVECN